jgi:hypothetical protein
VTEKQSKEGGNKHTPNIEHKKKDRHRQSNHHSFNATVVSSSPGLFSIYRLHAFFFFVFALLAWSLSIWLYVSVLFKCLIHLNSSSPYVKEGYALLCPAGLLAWASDPARPFFFFFVLSFKK